MYKTIGVIALCLCIILVYKQWDSKSKPKLEKSIETLPMPQKKQSKKNTNIPRLIPEPVLRYSVNGHIQESPIKLT